MPQISLSELSGKIKGAINASFNNQDYWVIAEITDHTFYPNHPRHYFSLVERRDNAITTKIQATAGPDSSAAIANFQRITGQHFTSGISVLVNLSVSFHEVHGLQVSLNDIDANYTIGQLVRDREHTKQRLLTQERDHVREENGQLVTTNKQKKLPIAIQNFAIISSHNARGYEDFVDTITENVRYKFNVDRIISSVQGENNAHILVNSLVEIYRSGKTYDAIVIVRGGGSETDFLIFDHFDVARAIARFPIPIIIGVGHQANQTISDLVAHTSLNTPSSAAEFIIQHNRDFEDKLYGAHDKIRSRAIERMRTEENKLSNIKLSLSQGVGPIISKHRNLYERSRNILIEHSTAILAHNAKLISNCTGITSNRPVGIITKNKSNILEVHSRLTQKCNDILNRRRQDYELCRNTLIEHSTVNLSYHTRLLQNARGIVINRPMSIVTTSKSAMFEVQSRLARSSDKILSEHRIDCERCRNVLREHSSSMLSAHLKLVNDAKGIILNRPIGVIAKSKSEFLEMHSRLTQRCNGIIVKRRDELRATHTSVVHNSKQSAHRFRTDLSDCIAKTTLSPRNILRSNQVDLNILVEKIKTNVTHNLRRKEDRLRAKESICKLMSPVNILKKGFAIVYAGDKVLTDGHEIQPSDNLSIRLIDTKINVTVTEKITTNGNEFDL